MHEKPFFIDTPGVLTKPDRSPEAAHEKWVRYIRGETEPLHHGWFCVKQPDTQSPHPILTNDGMHAERRRSCETDDERRRRKTRGCGVEKITCGSPPRIPIEGAKNDQDKAVHSDKGSIPGVIAGTSGITTCDRE